MVCRSTARSQHGSHGRRCHDCGSAGKESQIELLERSCHTLVSHSLKYIGLTFLAALNASESSFPQLTSVCVTCTSHVLISVVLPSR